MYIVTTLHKTSLLTARYNSCTVNISVHKPESINKPSLFFFKAKLNIRVTREATRIILYYNQSATAAAIA